MTADSIQSWFADTKEMAPPTLSAFAPIEYRTVARRGVVHPQLVTRPPTRVSAADAAPSPTPSGP